ncbi:MAG: hypothetical protein JWM07_148 [Candidatus Saccharibacteria bacterium]|nr:hypothetical protein [Candidatus Saccharibacteria bacterium]
MKKLLDTYQGKFGAIKKERIIAYLLVGAGFLSIVAAIWWGLSVATDIWRFIMILVLAVMTITCVVLWVRGRRNVIGKMPKGFAIPRIQHEATTAKRPNTAPIPIVAERAHVNNVRNVPQPTHAEEEPNELPSVEISAFARKRIAEENNINVTHGTFELRKSAKSLFIQYPKRIPFVKKEVQRKDRKTGKMVDVKIMKRPPPSTIYRELLLIIVSLGILLLPVLLGIVTLPDWAPKWATELTVAFKSSQTAPLIILAAGCIFMLYALGMFYKKCAYWHFWRAVLLPPGPQTSRHGFLVVIDMPPFLGGGAPLIDLKRVNRCYIATGVSERDEKGFGGLVMKILRIRWMIIDIPGDKDSDVNLMGPLKLVDAAPASKIIKRLSASANTRDNE